MIHITLPRIKPLSITIDIFFIIHLLVIVVLLFFIATIKMECVKIGYEIYNLSQEIEVKKIKLQNIVEERDMLVQPEKLFKHAAYLNLYPPKPERVFYVE
ncbi:MAG: hypothetical protein N3C60_06320 [Calditerrivibrio sp.]|nr:hypothetical protein [Calditerrivibrio sp.]